MRQQLSHLLDAGSWACEGRGTDSWECIAIGEGRFVVSVSLPWKTGVGKQVEMVSTRAKVVTSAKKDTAIQTIQPQSCGCPGVWIQGTPLPISDTG